MVSVGKTARTEDVQGLVASGARERRLTSRCCPASCFALDRGEAGPDARQGHLRHSSRGGPGRTVRPSMRCRKASEYGISLGHRCQVVKDDRRATAGRGLTSKNCQKGFKARSAVLARASRTHKLYIHPRCFPLFDVDRLVCALALLAAVRTLWLDPLDVPAGVTAIAGAKDHVAEVEGTLRFCGTGVPILVPPEERQAAVHSPHRKRADSDERAAWAADLRRMVRQARDSAPAVRWKRTT